MLPKIRSSFSIPSLHRIAFEITVDYMFGVHFFLMSQMFGYFGLYVPVFRTADICRISIDSPLLLIKEGRALADDLSLESVDLFRSPWFFSVFWPILTMLWSCLDSFSDLQFPQSRFHVFLGPFQMYQEYHSRIYILHVCFSVLWQDPGICLSFRFLLFLLISPQVL